MKSQLSFVKNQRQMFALFLSSFIIALSGCNKSGGGGDNGNGGGQTATVPGPQGVVTVQAYPNAQCNFNQTTGSYTCGMVNTVNQANAGSCQTTLQTYTDVTTLCQKLQLTYNETVPNVNCSSIVGVINQVFGQYCPGQALTMPQINNSTVITGQANQNGYKTFQCDLQARKSSTKGFFVQEIAPVSGAITVSNMGGTVLLSGNRFFGAKLNAFGEIKLRYIPAGIANASDKVVLSVSQLNDEVSFSQSGFAGDEIRLDAESLDGRLTLSVACKGQSNFKYVQQASARGLRCKGSSRLSGDVDGTDIDTVITANQLVGGEIKLADGLSAHFDGGALTASRMTLTAQGATDDISVKSSASVKAGVSFSSRSTSGDEVKLECSAQ